jgi:tetratricopeptide (TPR) repeat protein
VELLQELIIAKTAANRGDHASAEKLFGSLIEQHPTNASAQWEFGRYYGLRCEYKEAREHFSRAVELDPNYSSVEFKVKGHTIRLKDYPGSPPPLMFSENSPITRTGSSTQASARAT